LLLQFPSIVAAVEYAITAQKLMVERNADVPQDRRMLYRVGINLGDVIVEGDHILGDGVNVAARLESVAPPGGICLSDDAYRQVRGRVDVDFADMGEQRLKNIARPVRAYAVSMDTLASLPALPEKPPIRTARRYLWLGAAIVLVLVAGGVAINWWSEQSSTANLPTSSELAVAPAPPAPIAEPTAPSAPTADAIVWDVIKDNAAPDPFAAFLRTYPNSQYAAAARDKLAELMRSPPPPAPAASTPDIEGMIWAMIKDSTAAAPFEEYLRTYPNGEHADAARAKLEARAKLAERARAPRPPAPAVPAPVVEEMVWATVKDSTSVGPFQEYLRNYPNGDHAGAARAKLAELSRPPPAPLTAPPPATTGGADQARPQTTVLAAPALTPAPAAPSAQGSFDGRWQGEAPAITAGCDVARVQFQVTGNRISGTGSRASYGGGGNPGTTSVTGTIGPDGVGTIEWGQPYVRGTIKFAGDRFEAQLAVCTNTPRTFVGGRTGPSPAAAGGVGQFNGRWQGDAAFQTPGCGPARIQFQVSGNQISGTGAGPNWGLRVSRSTTVTGTIGPDGVGTIVWKENDARGTIKFTGDSFEARVVVLPCRSESIFSGGRIQ
jgi:hypothetical protein